MIPAVFSADRWALFRHSRLSWNHSVVASREYLTLCSVACNKRCRNCKQQTSSSVTLPRLKIAPSRTPSSIRFADLSADLAQFTGEWKKIR